MDSLYLPVCRVKTDRNLARIMKVMDKYSYIYRDHHGYSTLTDAILTPLADGTLLRVRGKAKVYLSYFSWSFWSAPMPEGWPTITETRAWWNPLRYIEGKTITTPITEDQFLRTIEVEVVVPPSHILGFPRR